MDHLDLSENTEVDAAAVGQGLLADEVKHLCLLKISSHSLHAEHQGVGALDKSRAQILWCNLFPLQYFHYVDFTEKKT